MRRLPVRLTGVPPRWAALGVSAVGAALALLVLALAIRPGHEVRATAAWGAIVLMSFAGWGDLARRHLVPEADVDWGLRAAWGLAVTVAVGGLLCLLGGARRPVLVAWICGGVALFGQALLAGFGAHGRSAPRPSGGRAHGGEVVLAVGLACATMFVYLGAAGHTFPNPSDDWPAYLPLVRKVLQTGTLVEPFSVRRMAAYGGQTLLQALTAIVAQESQIQIFDGGICLVLTVGLIIGFAREARNASWTLLLLAASAFLMLPDGRANSASEVSGVVGFVALWRTMTFVERRRAQGLGPALLIALAAAAVATLRQQYLVIVAIMLLALLARGDSGEGREERLRSRLPFFGRVALLTGACLLPWALLALRSNHTFLFPIFHGNYHPEAGGISVPTTWDLRLKLCFATFFHDDPIRSLPLFLLALPAAAAGANRRASLGLWLGQIVGCTLLCWNLPNCENYTIARYVFAAIVALMIVAGLAAAEAGAESLGKRNLAASGLVATALAIQIYATHTAVVKSLDGALDRMRVLEPSPPMVTGSREAEQKMQAVVPPKAPLLVMIDRPYMLDFARNPIDILDQPGAASPAPGIPLLEGPDKVSAYLQARGIRYVGFVRPEKAVSPIYTRSQWTAYSTGTLPLWRATAPYFLAAFDVLTHFAQTQRRLYDDGKLVVVDLAVSA